jgi:hypothetical protein
MTMQLPRLLGLPRLPGFDLLSALNEQQQGVRAPVAFQPRERHEDERQHAVHPAVDNE